jgi:hypothetical protein
LTLDWQTLLSLLILAAFAVMIFRQGSKNPVGTGSLQKQLNTIGSDLRSMKTDISGLASKSELHAVQAELMQIEQRTASSGELLGIQGQISALHERFDGRCGTLDVKIDAVAASARRTEAGVERIEGYFLQRGVDRS